MDTIRTTRERQLRELGFDPPQAARILSLRQRFERGEFREPTAHDRLLFARYLVQHGWLDEACRPRTGV